MQKSFTTVFKFLKSKKFLFYAGIIALMAFVFTVIVNIYILKTSDNFIYKKIADVPSKQVALILGARVYASGRMSDVMLDRAKTGVELYKAHKVRKILISGDHGTDGYDEVNAIKNYFLDMNVPKEDIFLDHAGFDTYDSVYRARDIFKVSSIIIVTQDFHLPRAVYLAHALGEDAVGFSADKQKYVSQNYNNFREIFSRMKAFLDVSIHAKPKFLGEAIPITGDSMLSWDEK